MRIKRQRIKYLKISLVFFAGALILLSMVWPNYRSSNTSTTFEKMEVNPDLIQEKKVLSPKFIGVDRQNQPYEVIAEAAEGNAESEGVYLKKPKAHLTLNLGEDLDILSHEGLFEEEKHDLFLKGGVTLKHSQGHEMKTKEAHVDFKKKIAEGEEEVKVESSFGVAYSKEGFQLTEDKLKLLGPSTLIIKEETRKGSGK